MRLVNAKQDNIVPSTTLDEDQMLRAITVRFEFLNRLGATLTLAFAQMVAAFAPRPFRVTSVDFAPDV
jgi:hypothetical protein